MLAGWQERFYSHVVERLAGGELGPHRLWTRSCSSMGHGQFWRDGKILKAHRVAWQLEKGPIPREGLRNRCGVKHCIEPTHWEPKRQRAAKRPS